MTLDKGDSVWAEELAIKLTHESDGSGSAGDFVTLNSSDQTTPVSAADDDIFGVLADDAPAAGEDVSVYVFGIVVANVDGAVAAGDIVEAEGTTAGQGAANAQGSTHSVDEGGTSVYRLSMGNPRCLIDAGGTLPTGESLGANEAAVFLR